MSGRTLYNHNIFCLLKDGRINGGRGLITGVVVTGYFL